MKARLVLAWLIMALSISAHAQECTPEQLSVEQTGETRANLVKQPSIDNLLKAISKASTNGITSQTVKVKIQYNRTGKVVKSSLENPTHDESLDQAILNYVNGFQLSTGSCGTGHIPINISVDDEISITKKNDQACMSVIGIPTYCGCISKNLGMVTFDQYVAILGHTKSENKYDQLSPAQKTIYDDASKIKEKCLAAH